MLSCKNRPDAFEACFSHFPEKLRPTLQLIQENAVNRVAVSLVQYVASFVHPDIVCNFALLDTLPFTAKQAVIDFFDYCLSIGLTIEEQGSLLAFIQPYIVATLRGPRLH
jgi:hypothetical protein